MTVVNVRKYGRTALAVCLIIVVVLFLIVFGRLYISAKADRSNAMQVAKPIAAEQVAAVSVSDFFTEYRLERDRLRSEKSEVLREAIRGAKNDDMRQKAQEAMLKLVVDKQKESEMENLIKAKGFADALVFIRENAVNAVVKAQSLDRETVVQVADIISRVGGVKPEDITISAKP